MKALSSTVAGNIVPSVSYTAGSYTLTGLVVGKNYYYTMGTNDTSIAFSGGATFAKSASATGVFTATATSATLSGTGTDAVGTTVTPILGVSLYPATVTPTLPSRLVTVGQFPGNNPSWVRTLQISDQYVFVKRGTYAVAFSLEDMVNLALTAEVNLTWTPPVILTQPVAGTCAGTAAATGTLTGSGSTNVADGDTVTLGATTYRFKNTMVQVNDVQIGGSGNSDTSVQNLIYAINGTGTPGTNYFTGTAKNASASAGTLTSHAVIITALNQGLAGNAIASTKSSSVVSWGGSTLSGGTDAATTFTILSGSEYALTYQWQYSTDSGATWNNCTGTVSGTAFTNGTSATLTCTPTTTGLTGALIQCVVTDDAGSFGLTNGSVNSTPVSLTIS